MHYKKKNLRKEKLQIHSYTYNIVLYLVYKF